MSDYFFGNSDISPEDRVKDDKLDFNESITLSRTSTSILDPIQVKRSSQLSTNTTFCKSSTGPGLFSSLYSLFTCLISTGAAVFFPSVQSGDTSESSSDPLSLDQFLT
ncbi:hypothetical protein OIU79_018277 [Salix purpurea]|uniref:Uncharacterized protein n=1 Tax=Salix purpurea TaxID=77065 RepID=A0A9Q1AL70_SALPP|nr:hypothetical protein OIU79_018277 [Salix purpurea]